MSKILEMNDGKARWIEVAEVLPTEMWAFELENGFTVVKKVVVAE